MYAKIELTRQTFKLWKWKILASEELFVGPFETRLHRDIILRLVVNLSMKFLQDQRYILVAWKELEELPPNATLTGLNDVMDNILCFVEGW